MPRAACLALCDPPRRSDRAGRRPGRQHPDERPPDAPARDRGPGRRPQGTRSRPRRARIGDRPARRDGEEGREDGRAPARRPDLPEGRPRRPDLSRVLRRPGHPQGQGPPQGGPGPRRVPGRRAGPLDDADRPGRPGLRLEDRRLGAALRPGRPAVLHRQDARQVPARLLVPRPGRDPERGQLPRRAADTQSASSRRPTRSSCTPTAATATPTSSPARSTPWRPSTSVKRRYRVDEDRIGVRGFSMGGAAAWQFAVHYTDLWFAANPGAGFSETPRFLKVFQNETLAPTWYEQKLWHLYDCDRVRRQPAPAARPSPTAASSTARSRRPT